MECAVSDSGLLLEVVLNDSIASAVTEKCLATSTF